MDKNYEKILEKVPESIDFSFITVKNETVRSFYLDNPTENSILFKIDNTDIYIFEPKQGVITKKHRIEIKVKIIPDSATVLIANSMITLDEKYSKIIKLSSIAKYPYLRISKNILDFGNVLIGKTREMELIINNPEKLPAKFIIAKKKAFEGKTADQFFLSHYKGEVPPGGSFLIKVKYLTVYPNYFSYETFDIRTKGGNKNRFSCLGNCLALSTHINYKNVNFGSIDLMASKTIMIRVFNESEEPTAFQFFYNNDGAFTIHVTQGLIEAKSNVRVNITFKPKETMIYYDRVFCLVKNHLLIALDLFGSCHDLLNKTKCLEQKHIDIFRYKITKGFYFSSQGNMLTKDFDVSTYFDNLNKSKKSIIRDKLSSDVIDDGFVETTNQTQLHKEMFWENSSPTRLFSSNIDSYDFRYVEFGKVSEPGIIKITNNSIEKIKLKWLLEKPINTSNLTKNYNLFSNYSSIFIISPEEIVVEAKSTVEFKVYFKPSKQEFYFFTNMICLGTLMTNYQRKDLSDKALELMTRGTIPTQTLSSLGYKTNLLKSLTSNEKQFEYFDPPVPIRVSLVGHSFPPNSQIFMPMMELTPEKEIIFPPSSVQQSMYQVLTIHNHSDTPLYFKFLSDSTNVFRVFPRCGLIPPKTFNLVCIEFCPKEINIYKFPLKVVFNHDTQNMHTVILHVFLY